MPTKPPMPDQTPVTALDELTRIACEIYREWDRDNDSRVGKMIGALGGTRGYRADIDALRDKLAPSPSVPTPQAPDGLEKALRYATHLVRDRISVEAPYNAAIVAAMVVTLENHLAALLSPAGAHENGDRK